MDNVNDMNGTGEKAKQNSINTLIAVIMLIFLLLRFFIPAEGLKGLLVTTCFYIALLFYVIMSFLHVFGKFKDMKEGNANAKVDKAFVWFMTVAIVGMFVVPYGLFNCGMDMIHGTEQLNVYHISVEKHSGNKVPTSYKLVTVGGSYSISGDTYYELEKCGRVNMNIVVYPHTKILVSYGFLE